MSTFDYRGVDKHQANRGGRREADSAADLALDLYSQRWQSAEITVDGRLVGQVTRNLNGERTWWGEKAGAQPKPPKPVRRRARTSAGSER